VIETFQKSLIAISGRCEKNVLDNSAAAFLIKEVQQNISRKNFFRLTTTPTSTKIQRVSMSGMSKRLLQSGHYFFPTVAFQQPQLQVFKENIN
jgi:hypothetical protein